MNEILTKLSERLKDRSKAAAFFLDPIDTETMAREHAVSEALAIVAEELDKLLADKRES